MYYNNKGMIFRKGENHFGFQLFYPRLIIRIKPVYEFYTQFPTNFGMRFESVSKFKIGFKLLGFGVGIAYDKVTYLNKSDLM